jgi:hypothetical protein
MRKVRNKNYYIDDYGNRCWYLEDDIQRPYSYDKEEINDQLCIKGKLCHREDGPAIECANETKKYFQYGKRHRIGGPAIEYADGYKEYYENDKRHREDGPAVEWSDGTIEYWLCNKRFYTKEEWEHYRDYLMIME